MSMEQLRKRWTDLFGTDSGRLGRRYLMRRLAYRIQELVYGGLSREACQKLAESRRGRRFCEITTKTASEPTCSPEPDCFVTGMANATRSSCKKTGFLYDGKKYRSLSAVPGRSRIVLERQPVLRPDAQLQEERAREGIAMTASLPTQIRCAVYTRKSHEEGLDQEFNSLDAQRQAGEAYIESQRHEGWQCLAEAI